MPLTFYVSNGPYIVGDSGLRYWWRVQSAPYADIKRKRPSSAEAILRNPTPWMRHQRHTNVGVAIDNGKVISPTIFVGESASSDYPFSASAALERRIRSKLLTKIKGEKWNANVFAAELAKTQSYFRSALERVVNATLALLRGRKQLLKRLARQGKRYLKKTRRRVVVKDVSGELSKLWMEWRYAVCPVVYDVEDMLKALYAESVKPDIRRAASGDDEDFASYRHDKYSRYTVTSSTSGTARGRMVANFRVNKNAEAFKRLGLINLTSVLWEVTPLSFVVDWFIPVGEMLGHLDALAGVDVLSVTYALTVESKRSQAGFGYSYKQFDSVYTFAQGPQDSVSKTYNRQITKLDLPKYDLRASLSGKRLLDACALSRLIIFKASR